MKSSQIKHLREKYVRFPLDFKPEVLRQFKYACQHVGTTPTTEIKKFVQYYIQDFLATEGVESFNEIFNDK